MTKRASGFGCATSTMWLNGTPSQVVSSFDQRVTQWMSRVTVTTGRARNSVHERVNGVSTSPKTRKSQRDRSGYSGVRPKWRTGNFSVRTCPGGIRLRISGSRVFFCQESMDGSVHRPMAAVKTILAQAFAWPAR